VPVKPNRLAPLSNTGPGPIGQAPGVGEPAARCLSLTPAQSRHSSPTQGASPDLLSLPPIKGGSGWKYPPFRCFFLPTEVSTTAAARQLATVLPGHSTIPLVELLLTPSCFFCPRFRDHQARAPASTAHPTGDLCRHR
jgi:hypothetical protein